MRPTSRTMSLRETSSNPCGRRRRDRPCPAAGSKRRKARRRRSSRPRHAIALSGDGHLGRGAPARPADRARGRESCRMSSVPWRCPRRRDRGGAEQRESTQHSHSLLGRASRGRTRPPRAAHGTLPGSKCKGTNAIVLSCVEERTIYYEEPRCHDALLSPRRCCSAWHSSAPAAAPATMAIDTPMPRPRMGTARAPAPGRQRAGVPGILREVLRRARLPAGLPPLGRERRTRRRVRELQSLAGTACARRRRRDPSALPAAVGRA